jgi:hypothetical protein
MLWRLKSPLVRRSTIRTEAETRLQLRKVLVSVTIRSDCGANGNDAKNSSQNTNDNLLLLERAGNLHALSSEDAIHICHRHQLHVTQILLTETFHFSLVLYDGEQKNRVSAECCDGRETGVGVSKGSSAQFERTSWGWEKTIL